MDTIAALLQARLCAALAALGAAEAPALIQPSADARFGDYQTNVAMVLAKARRANPRQLAQEIIAQLAVEEMCEPPAMAGAGFINFRLRPAWLAARFAEFLADPHLGVPQEKDPRPLVIDFSSPNVAKPMHVGHIRSTFLGDALCRIARFTGRRVIGDNHIGDWGTQFGMLLHGWKTMLDPAALAADPLSELERLYKLVSARSKEDPATLAAVHRELVLLQGGDAENLGIWREMIRLSQAQFDEIYGRLGVRFDSALGESFYNPMLAGIVEELRATGIAWESEGASSEDAAFLAQSAEPNSPRMTAAIRLWTRLLDSPRTTVPTEALHRLGRWAFVTNLNDQDWADLTARTLTITGGRINHTTSVADRAAAITPSPTSRTILIEMLDKGEPWERHHVADLAIDVLHRSAPTPADDSFWRLRTRLMDLGHHQARDILPDEKADET